MPVSSGAIGSQPISAAPQGGQPAGGARVFSLGGLGSPCCCNQEKCEFRFLIEGCGGSGVTTCEQVVSGAIVTVYASMGGTMLATGVSGSDGSISLTWDGFSGTNVYYLTVTATGYAGFSGNVTLTCSRGGAIPLSSNCCPDLQVGFPATLYFTVCGVTVTCAASFVGPPIIDCLGTWNGGTGGGSVSTPGCAVLVGAPGECTWDGATTDTADSTGFSVFIRCPTGTPSSLTFDYTVYYSSLVNRDTDTNALLPVSYSDCGSLAFNLSITNSAASGTISGSISGGTVTGTGTMPTIMGQPVPCQGDAVTLSS